MKLYCRKFIKMVVKSDTTKSSNLNLKENLCLETNE